MTPKTFEWSEQDGELVTHIHDVKISATESPTGGNRWSVSVRWGLGNLHIIRVDGFWQCWKVAVMIAHLLDRKQGSATSKPIAYAHDKNGAEITDSTPVRYFISGSYSTNLPVAIVHDYGQWQCLFAEHNPKGVKRYYAVPCIDCEVQSVFD